MNGIIKPTLKENIEWMMGGEKMANAEKREASEKAEEAGIETAADFFRESSKDEGRHYKILVQRRRSSLQNLRRNLRKILLSERI